MKGNVQVAHSVLHSPVIARNGVQRFRTCIHNTTPKGFPNKAKGCAYSRYPGDAHNKTINPGGVA